MPLPGDGANLQDHLPIRTIYRRSTVKPKLTRPNGRLLIVRDATAAEIRG